MSDLATLPSGLPDDLARTIGAAPHLAWTDDEPAPETKLDWALHWAARGLHVFPCKSFLGIPLTPKWYAAATNQTAQLVEWWTETPDADIAVVPDRSGHFVLTAVGDEGFHSLKALEDKHGKLAPDLTTDTGWGSEHLWFKGRALSSHHRLGFGLHVHGPGTYLYLPPSLAPLSIE